MAFFGSSWNDDVDDDDGFMGMAVGSAMKEDIRREQRESEISMFSHWNEPDEEVYCHEAFELIEKDKRRRKKRTKEVKRDEIQFLVSF